MANQLTSNRAYRLYAGHGNWINLNAQTTKDLLDIFTKGVPTRYQLAPGLSIDIIPHDVDCNSKNIDMLGLMRADLVYDSDENVTQQRMSNYIRDILDEQGIIDAFPPTKPDEELPPITSLPTHRHLSLVPSVAGSIRRGPKSSQGYASKSGPLSLKKRVATSPSRRSLKKPRQQKNELLKKIILPLSSNLRSDTNDPYPVVSSHSQHHPSDLCILSSSSSTYQPNPVFSLSASLHPSLTNDETDGQLNLQKLSPMVFLNEYEHDFSSQKDPVLSSYYPCSSTSSSSAITSSTANQLLERQQQQQSFPEESSPLDEPMMSSSCWVNVHLNDVKDEDEQWMSSIEYSRKDSNCSTNSHIFMHAPIMATRPFDNRSSMDQNYYFNDSSKSTTGPTSPSDFNDITTLPQNMKHIVMQSRAKQ
ncbi:uncharacterized protein RHIMIDRAFT_20863 [Rhizopus microsporus ATCC 52813]|uniref:Uncharacterized protein n=2 Tax=Rhizopus microsporus TaxID=58291 RepID=A0A2G4SQW9_RHIZD|nr:uncharacterized protein RHIMIDRAFT_20863 [Rhizopus microsporus ATCC 52813]PHZ11169.1 hypothetical protein RHIMIDRAFT_20863 [Rhizopus microsporus ATCC 52813]